MQIPVTVAILIAGIPALLVNAQEVASTQWTDDTEFQDAVLNATNTYRHQHDAAPLAWNDSLAEKAQDWADDCNWKHSGGPTGENLSTGYPNVSSAIAGWGEEREEYSYSDASFSSETGHFTQLVWQATTSVGCARTKCGPPPTKRHLHHRTNRMVDNNEPRHSISERDDAQKAWNWFFVCEYFPAGNVIGQFEGNVKEQSNSDPSPETPEGGSVPVGPGDTGGAAVVIKGSTGAWLVGFMAVAANA